MNPEKLVEIKGLKTRFKVGNQWAQAVNGVDLDIYKGETLGIVGESGSGKSVSVLSLIQLIPPPPARYQRVKYIIREKKYLMVKSWIKLNPSLYIVSLMG